MAAKPRITIVGAGNLGSALAPALCQAGYSIVSVVARSGGPSLKKARRLAKEVGAQAANAPTLLAPGDVVWICVPDSEIAPVASVLGGGSAWRGTVALHSSGALTSDVLAPLRTRGASVASVHPLMTFVAGSRPPLAGVPFAIEGDAPAVRLARRIVHDLGGTAYPIRKQDKAAYHAWGTFASPLFTALLATTEQVAAEAGVRPAEARRRMLPILRQTLANYTARGAPAACSGPIIRGDVDTIKRHLRVLRRVPSADAVYRALALAAVQMLPGKNKAAVKRACGGTSGKVVR